MKLISTLALILLFSVACGKLKTSDESSNSTENMNTAIKVYTKDGVLLGKYIGMLVGSNASVVLQFTDGGLGNIDTTLGTPTGYFSTYFDISTTFSCFYKTSNASGACYTPVDTLGSVQRNAIFFDGTSFYKYTGQEPTESITYAYICSYYPYNTTPSCGAATGTITKAAHLTTPWSLPSGLSFPLYNLIIGF
ncbi:MAG: hypothetical protein JSU04_12550 [Bdellovibrionales bacterium]|nr:hypothetical protein [Bdellovibrionales bacterium]